MPSPPSTAPKNVATSQKTTKATKKIESPTLSSVSPNAPKKTPASPKTPKKTVSPVPVSITPEERHGMICNAAYYLAERRGFIGGDPFQDWVEGEKEVDRLLGISQTG
jgi:hypothetical protein